MPHNILFVHHDGGVTGSTLSLRNLFLAFDRNRYAPRVLLAVDGPARKLYEDLGIPVDVLPMRRFWTFPGAPWYSSDHYRNYLALFSNRTLADYLKKSKPDLIHINDKTLLIAGITARMLGLPIVWHLRSSYFSSNSRLHAEISRRVIRWSSNRCIAISEDETDGFEDFPGLAIIHNSVDFKLADNASDRRDEVRAELGINAEQILIGAVSTTISEIRGTWDFLKAASLVKRSNPELDMRFIVVARIPDRSSFEGGIREKLGLVKTMHPEDKAWQMASEGGIASQLILTGFRKDALDIISAMDVVVACNRHGVMGRMPFEAMSVGRPVVATAGHSGRSQIIRDGETGFIVEPGVPESIAGAVNRLVKDPALRQKMSEAGRIYSRQEFDPSVNAKKIERVYEELLDDLAAGDRRRFA